MPGAAWVVECWKNKGMICTSPANDTTRMLAMIIRPIFFSSVWCEKKPCCLLAMKTSSGNGGRGDGGRARMRLGGRNGGIDGALAAQRHPDVPGHDEHARQIHRAAGEPDQVVRHARLEFFDEAVHQRAV